MTDFFLMTYAGPLQSFSALKPAPVCSRFSASIFQLDSHISKSRHPTFFLFKIIFYIGMHDI